MPEIMLKQSQVFTEQVYGSDSQVIGEITFKPSDARCMAGYSKLVSIYTEAMSKAVASGHDEEKYAEAIKRADESDNPEAKDIETMSEVLGKMADSFVTQAEAFIEMQPSIDDAFGDGAEKMLFNGGCDMPLMFALIDWASQYADSETNKDWQEYKERAERLKAAKLNREQRRARK